MKWNIEWVDLQNIERMTSECWRLNEKQLQQYCERLSQQQDLVFAGELGLSFLEIMQGLSNRQAGSIWSDIQKDVHMLQRMIQQGITQDKHYWIRLYHDLSDQPEFYFYTKLGTKFISLIAAKLEVDIPEEQKFLRHDIKKIQEICDTCDFQDETMAKETIASLKEQENMLFFSWLGVDFLHIIERRFGEKEEPELPSIPEQKNARRGIFHKKNLDHALEDPDKEEFEDLDYLHDLETLSDFNEISDQDILSDQEALLNGKLLDLPLKNNKLTDMPLSHKEKAQDMSVDNGNPLNMSINSQSLIDTPMNNESLLDRPVNSETPVDMPKKNKQAGKIKVKSVPSAAKIICTIIICIVMCILGIYLFKQINKREIARKAAESLKNRNTNQTNQIEEESLESSGVSSVEVQHQDMQAAGNQPVALKKQGESKEQQITDRDSNKNLKTIPVQEKDGSSTDDSPDILAKYRSFHEQYPDLFGWLTIPYTEIDHPVMQSPEIVNGELYYYLHHDYQGNATEEGSLFVDSGSCCYPQDYNTVIYGHNMKNGRNFGMLECFEDRAFCEAHRTIYYDTIYEKGTYQVAAVVKSRVLYQEEPGFRYYQLFNYDTHEKFQECVDFIKANQLYDLGVQFHYGDKFLMLSTCDYSHENGRLVVVAKKV